MNEQSHNRIVAVIMPNAKPCLGLNIVRVFLLLMILLGSSYGTSPTIGQGNRIGGNAKERLLLEMVNMQPHAIPALSYQIDAKTVWDQLAVPRDTAITIQAEDTTPIPFRYLTELTNPSITVYSALGPFEKKRAYIQAAEASIAHEVLIAEWDRLTQTGIISNGVITIQAGDVGSLYYGNNSCDSHQEILKDMYYDGALADRPLGRMLASKAEEFGITPLNTKSGRIDHARAYLGNKGPILEIHKSYANADKVTSVESWELLQERNVVYYRVTIQNDSTETVYLVNFQNYVSATFSSLTQGKKLFKNAVGPHKREETVLTEIPHRVYGQFQIPTMLYTLRDLQSGIGLGVSYLKQIPPAAGQLVPEILGEAYLYFNDSSFRMEPVDCSVGPTPLTIEPKQSVEIGYRVFVVQPGPDPWLNSYRDFMDLENQPVQTKDTGYSVILDNEVLQRAVVRVDASRPYDFCRQSIWQVHHGDVTLHDHTLQIAADENGASISCPLKINLHDRYRFNLNIKHMSPNAEITLQARHQGDGIVLGNWNRPGHYQVSLPAATELPACWSQPKVHWDKNHKLLNEDSTPIQLILDVVGAAGSEAEIDCLQLSLAEPEAPKLISPVNKMTVTDICASFKWRKTRGAETYELQLDTVDTFPNPISKTIASKDSIVRHIPKPEEVLPPKQWYWRVRGIGPNGRIGQWSQKREMNVVNDHAAKPLGRTISAENPLFLLEAWRVPELKSFRNVIPENLKSHVALVVGEWNTHFPELSAQEYYAPLQQYRIPAFIMNLGPNDTNCWESLADLEWVFQNIPSVRGVIMFEAWGVTNKEHYKGIPLRQLIKSTIILCAKYGKHFAWTDGMWAEPMWQIMAVDPEFRKLWDTYHEYIIVGHKTTIAPNGLTSMATTQGLWLTGKADTLMIWAEPWYWSLAGFKGLDQRFPRETGIPEMMPDVFWIQQMLIGLSQGASVFAFGGQHTCTLGADTRKNGLPQHFAAPYDNFGQTTAVYHDVILPFISAVIERNLVPHKKDIRANIKSTVSLDEKPYPNQKYGQGWGKYQSLFEAIYHVEPNGVSTEVIPNNQRYYYFPILPWENPTLVGIENVALDKLQTPEQTAAYLQSLVKENYHGDDVYVCSIGNLMIIMNSHENRDALQSFRIPVHYGTVSEISGSIGPHEYVIFKYDSEKQTLWMQANGEYKNRSLDIAFTCTSRPQVTLNPDRSCVTLNWQDRQLKMVTSFEQGFIEAEFSTQPTLMNSFSEVDNSNDQK